MDLISREAVDNAMHDYCHSCDVNESQMENYFCDLPSAFEGMTNGEVIQTLFPNANYDSGRLYMHIINVNTIGEIVIPWRWWNAPY